MKIKLSIPSDVKPISEFEGFYYIAPNGVVYSIRGNDERGCWGIALKTFISKKGYPTVTLRIGEYEKKKLIHRLVAEAFIPNPENKPEVNHDDGNKLNFAISNLKWSTSSENKTHAYRIGLRSNKRQPIFINAAMPI